MIPPHLSLCLQNGRTLQFDERAVYTKPLKFGGGVKGKDNFCIHVDVRTAKGDGMQEA